MGLKTDSKIWRKRLAQGCQIFAALCFLSPSFASAHQFYLGVGGLYGQVNIPSQSGSGSAIYRGPGLVFEPRFRFVTGDFFVETFGLDVFGSLSQSFGQNIADGVDEPNSSLAIGGGIDLRISSFFVGMQYSSTSSEIGAEPGGTTLSYPGFGARVGVNLLSMEDRNPYSLILAVTAERGSATIGGVDRAITRYSGSLVVGWDLFSPFSRGY